MSNNPYSNCPCGSGKKLKFCCSDILPDLQRISRLQENQPEAAEKQLRDLLVKFPNREVLVAELCDLLRQMNRDEECREILTAFLKQHPDHPRGLMWLSRLALTLDGFEASRRLIHRTFQISSRTMPLEMAQLAHLIGLNMISDLEYMGGREHLALSARLAGPEQGRQYLMNLAMLEADNIVPVVLRTPHSLLPVSGSDETMQQDLRARKLSLIGCWEPAAIIYSRLSETNAQNGAIWHNLGLCRAWDGRSADAAAALHKAATLLTDPDTAAEAESLAQLLDQKLPERSYALYEYRLPVRSGSELLTVVEDMEALIRYGDEDLEDAEKSTLPPGMDIVAMFDLLNRPSPADAITDVSQLSEVIADVELLDIIDEAAAAANNISTPILRVVVVEDQAEAVLAELRRVCGDLLLPVSDDKQQPSVAILHPRDAREFDCRLYCPDDVTKSQYRKIVRGWNDELASRWMNRPLLSLGGKTPADAAKDPSMKVVLAAAVLTLSVNARYYERPFDVSLLRRKLQIADPAPTSLSDGQHCAAFPCYFLQRLDCIQLNDQHLIEYCNRVSMLGFADLAKKGLDELLRRQAALEQFGVVRACLMRASIARTESDPDTITSCMQTARKTASVSRESFRELLEIEIRELAMRLDDPTDPELIVLLHRIRDRYIGKLPEIGEVIQGQLMDSHCEHLLQELELPVSIGAQNSGGLWTPQSEAEQGGGGSLWLPGQQ